MKKALAILSFMGKKLPNFILCAAISTTVFLSSGCIKTGYVVPVPANLAQDKTASFDELIKIIHTDDSLKSLQCSNIKATLTLGKVESGKLEEFRRSQGYILLKRPDLLNLRINSPIGGALLELFSKDDQFDAWFRGKMYTGKNSAKGDLVPDNGEEFKIPARPQHLFDAIMPPAIDASGVFVSLEEQTAQKLGSDEITVKQKNNRRQKNQAIETARYYVLSFGRQGAGNRIHVFRKTWIERTGLTIARQQMFSEEGQIVGDCQYFERIQIDGVSLPLIINIDRPSNGYSLKLECTGWKVNPDLEDKVFIINRPGAETIHLIEKAKAQ
jgi:hypothetical protein